MGELVTSIAGDIETWILAMTSSWWIYVVLYVFATIDGFFPPIPSESVVITLAVAAVANGEPNLWLVLGAGAAGAWTGDQIAFHLGRWIGTDRIPFLQGPRGRRAVAWAERALKARGASFILAARYIPIGRVAVNMSAGAVHFKRERFMVITAIAAVLWAGYSVLIGLAAATWLGHSTLLAMVVGVGFGILAGIVLDQVLSRVARRRERGANAAGTSGD